MIEWRGREQLEQQFMDALLEGAILRTEAVGWNTAFDGRNPKKQRKGIHPPGEPRLELRLAAEFVDEVTIIVEDGAVCDHVRRAARSRKFRCNLRVENPELAFERGGRVHGKRRLARHFRDQLDVLPCFFQQRADFVGERGLADAMRSDEREFQYSSAFAQALGWF